MNARTEYYRQMTELAQKQRNLIGLQGVRVLKSDIRKLFKLHSVQIDLWPFPGMTYKKPLKSLRGAYINDPIAGPCVLISRNIPDEPQIFTMAHELKHHLVDQDSVTSFCQDSNLSEMVEVGAEVFAAELIFPQKLFYESMISMGVKQGGCTAEDLVKLKHSSNTTLSYAGLVKRAEYFKFATSGSLAKVKWKILEELTYGEPVYKRIQRFKSSSKY